MKSVYFAPYKGQRGRREPERKHKINREIKGDEFRVIAPDGEMLGVMPRKVALTKAERMELDLIEIAPKATPPVVKIMDYGKYVYELAKKEKTQRKNQSKQQLKEIRFKWRTDTHDFNFKTKHAKDFLSEGNKVKGSVMFRGREITHREIGAELLKKFVAELEEYGKLDSPLKMEGRNLTVILSPLNTNKK